MARTKEFDEAEVLGGALDLFHARGFERTSFADLVEELGVSRQSLYDTYGNKEALYHAALRRYLERARDRMRRCLDGEPSVTKAFEMIFAGAVDSACAEGKGCLMVNAMIERSHEDAEVRALAQEHARSMQEMFASRLVVAQRAGQLARSADPVALGRYLYHVLLSVGVAARALGDREGLRSTAALALRALE